MARSNANYTPYYGETGFAPVAPRLNYKYHYEPLTNKNYDEALEALRKAPACSVDCETNSLEFTTARLASVQVSFGEKSYCLLFWHQWLDQNRDKLPDREKCIFFIREALKLSRVYAWNLYYDQRVLIFNELGITRHDFMNGIDPADLLFYMDTNAGFIMSLKDACPMFLGISMEHFDADWLGDAVYYAPHVKFIKYGCLDTHATLLLGEKLYFVFKRFYPFILKLHMKFKPALYKFETVEQEVDLEYVKKLKEQTTSEIEAVKSEFYENYGMINLGSSAQKSQLLEKLGYFTGQRNKPRSNQDVGDMSTKAELLEALVKDQGCKPAQLMLNYNKLSKLLSSSIEPVINFLLAGKIPRFHFLDSRVPTMRMASGKYTINRKAIDYFLPINLQSIPKAKELKRQCSVDFKTMEILWKDELDESLDDREWFTVETGAKEKNFRKAFRPAIPEDYIVVRGDFSGEELRIAANYSLEPAWVQAFLRNADIHFETAGKVWPNRHITSNDRKKAKIANFLLLYLGTAYSLAHKMKISEEEANEIEKGFRTGLRRLYEWKDEVILEGRRTGTVSNVFGMPRRVYSYYRQRNRKIQAFADRTCVNTKVQGTAGIIMRVAMCRFYNMVYCEGGKYFVPEDVQDIPGKYLVKFHNNVHDELVAYVHKSVAHEFIFDLEETMRTIKPPSWPVPLEVGMEIGVDYGSMIPLVLDIEHRTLSIDAIVEDDEEEGSPEDVISASDVIAVFDEFADIEV